MRPRTTMMRATPVVLALTAALSLTAAAGAHDERFHFRLKGYEEVPAVFTEGSGRFKARVNKPAGTLTYELRYEGLGNIQQAHIHFAQKGSNGGITVFLCTNLGNGPSGTPLCPDSPGTVTGTIEAADVIDGAALQGIAAGDLDALIEAILDGIAYVNVHTTRHPSGEIRGQFQ